MNKKFKLVLLILFLILLQALIFFPTQIYSVLSIADSRLSVFSKFLPKISKAEKESRFESLISEIENKQGIYSVYIKDLSTSQIYQYNQDYEYYAASLYKTPIAVAYLKNVQDEKASLEDKITFYPSDHVSGTGTIGNGPYNTQYTAEYVIDRLLKDSDNSAQSMLERTIPQEDLISAYYLVDYPNYYHYNKATAVTIGNYFENLVKSDYLNQYYLQMLISKMSRTSFDNRIYAGLEPDITFSHKIGSWGHEGSWHDCGIASKDGKQVIVCIMSKNVNYSQYLDINKKTGQFVNLFF